MDNLRPAHARFNKFVKVLMCAAEVQTWHYAHTLVNVARVEVNHERIEGRNQHERPKIPFVRSQILVGRQREGHNLLCSNVLRRALVDHLLVQLVRNIGLIARVVSKCAARR